MNGTLPRMTSSGVTQQKKKIIKNNAHAKCNFVIYNYLPHTT